MRGSVRIVKIRMTGAEFNLRRTKVRKRKIVELIYDMYVCMYVCMCIEDNKLSTIAYFSISEVGWWK